MFKELGMLAGLMGKQGKIQEEMGKFQQNIEKLTAEGVAGGGYVTVKVGGKMDVQSVRITPEALALNDRELLEDLIAAATNQAIAKVKELIAQETMKMSQNIGLPPGMLGGLPGLG